MRLEVQEIAASVAVGGAKEMIEAEFEYLRNGGVAGDVAAEFAVGLIGAHDHGECVPAHDRRDARLHFEMAGEWALALEWDRISVGRKRQHVGEYADVPGLALERRENVLSALGAGMAKRRFQRIEPIRGFRGIAVDQLCDPSRAGNHRRLAGMKVSRLPGSPQ